MKSFEELEKENQRNPVCIGNPNAPDAHGVLVLAREQSEVILSSSKPFECVRDDSGWFDLRLNASNGSIILLQNALSLETSSSYVAFSKSNFQEKIFPNIVIFKANHLPNDALINSISFSFPAIKDFFYYRYFERLGIHDAEKNDLEFLRKLKGKKKVTSDFFCPMDIYLVHKPSKYLIKFQVDSRTYSVFSGLHMFGPSHNKIDIETHPLATIKFNTSTTIDKAINYVWEWKRFFEQVALKPFNVDTLSVHSKGRPLHETADIYLPNVEQNKESVHPGDIPLNKWKDRTQLAKGMQKWLSKEDERNSSSSSYRSKPKTCIS